MKKNIIMITIIIMFMAVAGYSIRGVLTPYVPFKKAMISTDYVQIIGALDKSVKVEQDEKYLKFSLMDTDGTVIMVKHDGVRPANFEHANQVLAIGRYDAAEGMFTAEKILVKCPSKYVKENNGK
jgi:cytochrome c-type biogenesis protein CcmE